MALGVSTDDFQTILTDLGVSVTKKTATRTIDPIYGGETITYAEASKTWIFFDRFSLIDLKRFAIEDIGDAYVVMTTSDSMSYGDRVTYNSETFEFTPDCKVVDRFAGGTNVYRFYTLKKVA